MLSLTAMIFINGRFLTQNISGVQRFAFELSKELSNQADVEFLIPKSQSINPDYLNLTLPTRFAGNLKGPAWEQFSLPLLLKKESLLLNLCNTGPLSHKNQIVTIHDLAFLKGKWHSFAFQQYYRALIPVLLKQSRHVLTVSEFSKREIVETYKFHEEKITVIHNAPSFCLDQSTEGPDLSNNTEPYILSVGSIEPRKNLKRLITAFLKIPTSVVLYLTGKYNNNFKNDPELSILIEKNTSRIKFLGYVPDAELISLYKNALFFVFPSLYEGFGLPPIEAMALGCPVLTSNITSLPEVCGDAAMYCDPYSIDDMSQKMKYLLENDFKRGDLKMKGFIQAKKYSWSISARKLLSVLK